MSLSKNNRADWSDVQQIFNNLNKARQKYGKGAISDSAGGAAQARMKVQTVQNLKSGVEELASVGNLSEYTTISGSIPLVGDLITPTYLNNIKASISSIQSCSNYNSTNVANYNGSGYHSGGYNSSYDYGGYDSTYNNDYHAGGYNSTYDGEHHASGYNSTHCGKEHQYQFYYTTGDYKGSKYGG